MKNRIKGKGVFTPATIAEFCERLKPLDYRESVALGNSLGIRRQSIEVLRTLLGYTQDISERIPKEVKMQIVEDGLSGMVASDIAKKYGLRYNVVRKTLASKGAMNKKNDFWTDRKIMTLCRLIKDGKRNKEISQILGIKISCLQSIKYRLVNRRDCDKWIPIAEKVGLYAA